jgi:diacylglycerol O-acyltransferase / wax synthase
MRLSSHDASFLYSETASGAMHSIVFTVIEGAVSFDSYFSFMAQRIHLVPRLRQRLVFVANNLAHPKWVDDPDFDLANHIVPTEVPPGSSLEDVIAHGLALGEPLMDRTRPMWVTYVAENVEGNTVLIQLSHHAMIDGASAVEIGNLTVDFAADAPPPAMPDSPWEPAKLPTPAELVMEAMQETAANVASFAMSPLANVPDPSQVIKANSIMQRFVQQPVMTTPFNASLIGPKRTLSFARYRLDEFKAVRRQLGGTINDVVLSVVSEAAARYMADQGESVDGQYMRLMVPVDVREAGDTEIGNKVSGLYPTLPAWPMDVVDRHQAVCSEMDKLKSNGEAEAMHAMMQGAESMPAAMMASTLAVGTPFDPTRTLAQFPLPVLPSFGNRPPFFGFNFTCTNIPGQPAQTFVARHKVLFVTGTMMLGGVLGLGVSCGSGNGDLLISLTADPRLVPDVAQLRDLIEVVFAELQLAAVA